MLLYLIGSIGDDNMGFKLKNLIKNDEPVSSEEEYSEAKCIY